MTRPRTPQALCNPSEINRKQWPKEKRTEFKTTGACYECGRHGHLGRDCLQRNLVNPPSTLIANAIRLQNLDTLTSIKRDLASNTTNVCTLSLGHQSSSLEHDPDSEHLSETDDDEDDSLEDIDTASAVPPFTPTTHDSGFEDYEAIDDLDEPEAF